MHRDLPSSLLQDSERAGDFVLLRTLRARTAEERRSDHRSRSTACQGVAEPLFVGEWHPRSTAWSPPDWGIRSAPGSAVAIPSQRGRSDSLRQKEVTSRREGRPRIVGGDAEARSGERGLSRSLGVGGLGLSRGTRQSADPLPGVPPDADELDEGGPATVSLRQRDDLAVNRVGPVGPAAVGRPDLHRGEDCQGRVRLQTAHRRARGGARGPRTSSSAVACPGRG
jgi:hypothetical protein